MSTKILDAQFIAKFIKEIGGFNKVVDKVNIVNAGGGKCTAELLVSEEHANHIGTLHGGYAATLVDIITTCALITHENCQEVPSVSVDMHITYIKGVSVGEEIIIDASTTKVGKTLCYLSCEIKHKVTGDVLVKGSHTKFLMRS